jgi:isopentenyldiphosphate isomerase
MEEMVDVVSTDDVKLGIATRREVHKSGAWHRGVHVLVFNSRGELLVQRRSTEKDKSPGALDLSVSEHSKAGETYDEAAARGLREELGIAGIPFAKVLKFRLVYGPADNMISVLYRSTYDGKLVPDASEVDEVVAYEPEALQNLVREDGPKLTLWAREILRWYLHLPSGVEEA